MHQNVDIIRTPERDKKSSIIIPCWRLIVDHKYEKNVAYQLLNFHASFMINNNQSIMIH